MRSIVFPVTDGQSLVSLIGTTVPYTTPRNSRIVKLVPTPRWLRTAISPPWAVKMALASANPIPTLFSPVSTNTGEGGKNLVAQFNKADIDNNTPEGDSVPLVLTVNVLQNGVQKQLTSTALVKVEK